jgi:hypothetical protein
LTVAGVGRRRAMATSQILVPVVLPPVSDRLRRRISHPHR